MALKPSSYESHRFSVKMFVHLQFSNEVSLGVARAFDVFLIYAIIDGYTIGGIKLKIGEGAVGRIFRQSFLTLSRSKETNLKTAATRMPLLLLRIQGITTVCKQLHRAV